MKWFLYTPVRKAFSKKEWNQVLVLQLRSGYDFFLIKSMML
jgi:hypothetical protein